MIKEKKYLDLLQIYRGLAALFVILHHNVASIRHYHNFDNYFLSFIGVIGKYGVDFFFVLSGFIISYTSISKVDKKGTLNNYLKKRFLRIYVPYLPIGIAVYFIYVLFSGFSNSEREVSMVTSFTLFPYGRPALSIAWTLTFEILFYLIYSIRFFGKNIFRTVLLFWVCLILGVNLFIPESINNNGVFYKTITSFYNIEFLMGVLLAYIFAQKSKINFYLNIILIAFFGVLFIYVITIEFTQINYLPNLIYSCFVLLVMYLTISYINISIKSTNLFMIIGNASYSIYLVHNNIQALITRFFPKISIELRVILILLTALIISSLIGYIYSILFEKKLTNYFKHLFLK